MKLEMDGKEVILKIEDAEGLTKKGLRIAWHEIGTENRRYARKKIRTGRRSGRVYIVKGKRHRASAPGEFPKKRTGHLAKSVFYRVVSWYKMEFGNSAEYAKYLESFGMARFFLAPTIQAQARNNVDQILYYTDREIKK